MKTLVAAPVVALFAALVAAVAGGGALAQSETQTQTEIQAGAPTDIARIHVACEAYFTMPIDQQGTKLDCQCVAAHAAANYGAVKGEIVIRMLAAGASGDEAELIHVSGLFGRERVRGMFTSAEEWASVGQKIDQACPPDPQAR